MAAATMSRAAVAVLARAPLVDRRSPAPTPDASAAPTPAPRVARILPSRVGVFFARPAARASPRRTPAGTTTSPTTTTDTTTDTTGARPGKRVREPRRTSPSSPSARCRASSRWAPPANSTRTSGAAPRPPSNASDSHSSDSSPRSTPALLAVPAATFFLWAPVALAARRNVARPSREKRRIMARASRRRGHPRGGSHARVLRPHRGRPRRPSRTRWVDAVFARRGRQRRQGRIANPARQATRRQSRATRWSWWWGSDDNYFARFEAVREAYFRGRERGWGSIRS